MSDIVDIVDQLVMRHLQQACSDGESVYSKAAAEIVRLRADLAQMKGHVKAWTNTALDFDDDLDRWTLRADRAEADADRLAEQVGRLMCACGPHGYVCSKCVVLDLHDKEVEAR